MSMGCCFFCFQELGILQKDLHCQRLRVFITIAKSMTLWEFLMSLYPLLISSALLSFAYERLLSTFG